MNDSPFHTGEQQVQARMGIREQTEPWARQAVRHRLPEQHRDFYASLPFMVVAARDRNGRPWASVLTGTPGFVHSPDPGRLAIDAQVSPGDALDGALAAGADLGLLGITFDSRRRNRVNGRIVEVDSRSLLIEVDQAFGNCPRYIHARSWRYAPVTATPARRASRLSPAMREWIRAAGTFFIASGYRGPGEHPSYGMDASHRGGAPGFVHVEGDTRLVFPDYAGNNYFNTIGNLIEDPRAGLLFVDFEGGGLLQLTGRADIDWGSRAVARFPGARRLVVFDLEEAVEQDAVLPMRWSTADEVVRSLHLVEKTRESDDVTSFVLEARDGRPLADFAAGQHLPIALRMPGRAGPVNRTYSISNAPGSGRYRITVKREPRGHVSRHLHERIETGAQIETQPPAGGFVLRETKRPVVLISAGIGLTPLVSMLHALTARPGRQPVWFIHGARDGAHYPLAAEIRELVAKHEGVDAHVAFSRPRSRDLPGVDYDSTGRIDAELIARLLPDLDAEFYLCGPTGFMATLRTGLLARGVAPECIHTESFGPN